MSGTRRSNGNGSGHRPSQSSSSGYSSIGSIQEIVRPGASAGPSRVQTSNTRFYSQPGGQGDYLNPDRVNRPVSQSSVPPYDPNSPRPPSYRPPTNASDPPSYHSRHSSQDQGQQQQQQRPQQQQQQQRPPQQQQQQQRPPQQQQQQRPPQQQQQQQQHLAVPQPRPSRRQRTSERLRNMFRRNRD